MECLHFSTSNFHPETVIKSLKESDDEHRFCSECQEETESKWICLSCGVISCGRYVKGHALEHFKKSKHLFALDLESKACHCYLDDEYIVAGKFENQLEKLRKQVTEILAGLDSPVQETPMLSSSAFKGKTLHITGLDNLGNTCYMNVVLQILVHSSPIQTHFLGPLTSPMTPAVSIASRRATRSATAQEHTLWTQFRNLILEMWETSEVKFSPDDFLTFMRKKLPMFAGYQQQDAQEFLRALLDKMHEELNEKKGKTLIMQMFQGQFVNEVTCRTCQTKSQKEELFLDISLSIPIPEQANEKTCTIHKCLESFIALEELADSDLYDCTNCKSLQSATKRMILDRIPPILVLHLKRFRFRNNSRTKIDTHVSFPLKLDLNPYVSNPIQGQVYSLYGVIVHKGTAGSGHYIAFIKHENSWFEMNDRKATRVEAAHVQSQSAYMLFFEREMSSVVLKGVPVVPKKRPISPS